MTLDLLTEGLTVFAVIFLFEIVDRTNFAMVSLSGKHPPLQVWTGAALAFVVSSAISVAVGAAIVHLLPSYLLWVKVAGGAILIAFGAREIWEKEEVEEVHAEDRLGGVLPPGRVRMTAFALILFLEMGDNTQILTFEFVASAGSAPGLVVLLVIFAAATLALWCTSAIGARSGAFLRKRVPVDLLEKLLGGILVVVGLLTILVALFPNLLPPI